MNFIALVKYSKMSDYCPSHFLYQNKFVPAVMSQNRFQEILRFADKAFVGNDRLGIIRPWMSWVQNLKN